MNATDLFDLRLEQQGRRLLEKISQRKELFGTVRPCFNSWQPLTRKYHSSYELRSERLFWGRGEVPDLDDCIEFIDATEPTNDFFQVENIVQPWKPEDQEKVEEDPKEEDTPINPENLIFETAPEDIVYKCRIRREKVGTFPVFCLYFQHALKKRTFLLASKKSMLSKSGSYTISTDPENFSRKAPSYIGKLKSNLIGTKYTMFGVGRPTKRDPYLELGGVIYKKNLFGLKGPRKFTVILPSVDENGTRTVIPASKKPSGSVLPLHESFKRNLTDRIVSFQNKNPTWDTVKKSYVINFDGRVKRASVKNFKLTRDTNPESLVMQFGKVSRDSFIMDYSYPLCALQAFGIALSSFDYKIACE